MADFPDCTSFIDTFLIELMGIDAGAVIYHSCFPARFAVLKNFDAFVFAPSVSERISKPFGGVYAIVFALFAGGGNGVVDFLQVN